MKTLLDLIQEFALLNEAKTLAGGVLSPPDEERFQELRAFYGWIMAQDGLAPNPAGRFTGADIRERVGARERLRVDTDMETVALLEAEARPVRVANVSRGGALLRLDGEIDVGCRLTLHLARLDRSGGLLSTEGAVVWRSDAGASAGSYGYRAGVQYRELDEPTRQGLDALVVDSLEAKLLSLRREALDEAFLRREGVTL